MHFQLSCLFSQAAIGALIDEGQCRKAMKNRLPKEENSQANMSVSYIN